MFYKKMYIKINREADLLIIVFLRWHFCAKFNVQYLKKAQISSRSQSVFLFPWMASVLKHERDWPDDNKLKDAEKTPS